MLQSKKKDIIESMQDDFINGIFLYLGDEKNENENVHQFSFRISTCVQEGNTSDKTVAGRLQKEISYSISTIENRVEELKNQVLAKHGTLEVLIGKSLSGKVQLVMDESLKSHFLDESGKAKLDTSVEIKDKMLDIFYLIPY